MNRPKLNRMEKALFAAPLLVVLLALPSMLGPSQQEFAEVLRKLSGPDAIDYGFNTAPSGKALLAIVKTGKPFRAMTATGSVGNRLAGMVRTPKGKLYNLRWRSATWFSQGRVVSISRVRHPRLIPNGDFAFDSNTTLSPAEQSELLQKGSTYRD